jgi:hypothetical protein
MRGELGKRRVTVDNQKRCTMCKGVKPTDQFYKNHKSADRHGSQCKICSSNYRRTWAQREHIRERLKKMSHEYRLEHPESTGDSRRLWRAKYPQKKKAHSVIWRAIKKGRIAKQPCSICGEINTHAHHDDYNQPLNIRWLCKAHHVAWHRVFITEG